MSDFFNRFNQRQALLDKTYSEPLQIIPWVAGDFGAGGADPRQVPYVVNGILDDPTDVIRIQGGASVQGARPDLLTSSPSADFDLRVFAGFGMPQSDWRLVAISRPGQPQYKFVAPKPDGIGARLTAALVALDGDSA